MRSILSVLWEFRHPVSIVTKSALIARDLDILGPMAREGLTKVFLSVTTLDRKLARAMEPRAATPERRIETLQALAAAGVPCGVMTAPIIPALNDHEMEDILAAAARAGVKEAGYTLLRLPLEIKDLFREWLESEVPARAKHVLSLIRSMRGGKDYDSNWGTRMTGTGPYSELIANRFGLATKKLGLNRYRSQLTIAKFRKPPRAGDQLLLSL
jgi:DNA repair photolyase